MRVCECYVCVCVRLCIKVSTCVRLRMFMRVRRVCMYVCVSEDRVGVGWDVPVLVVEDLCKCVCARVRARMCTCVHI